VLVISHDSQMRDELDQALRSLSGTRPVVHFANDFLQAVESARSRCPHFAFLEMTGDMDAFRSLAAEIAAVSPTTVLVGMYRPDAFPADFWDDMASGSLFVQAIRAGVRDVLRRPVSRGDLEQLFNRIGTVPRDPSIRPARLGTIVSTISNKGGVGKSTTAINVAMRLAQRHPRRVLLVDCSLQMGVCASMLDLQPRTTILDAVRERRRLDETLVRQLALPHRAGLDLLAAPPDAVSATEIDDEMVSHILTLARRVYDYVVVDTFPLLDRVVMSVLDLSDLVYMVLDNVVPTVLSLQQLVKLLDGLDYDASRQRVVINRYARAAGNPTLDDVAAQLGRPIAHVMPLDNRAMIAANTGIPFALQPRRWSRLEKGLQGIVDEIESYRSAGSGESDASSPQDSERTNERSVNGVQGLDAAQGLDAGQGIESRQSLDGERSFAADRATDRVADSSATAAISATLTANLEDTDESR
jgi:pilus assembly protein CpaE